MEKINKKYLPPDYEKQKDSLLDFLETAFMLDIKLQSQGIVIKKTDEAIDNFTEYLIDYVKKKRKE